MESIGPNCSRPFFVRKLAGLMMSGIQLQLCLQSSPKMLERSVGCVTACVCVHVHVVCIGRNVYQCVVLIIKSLYVMLSCLFIGSWCASGYTR